MKKHRSLGSVLFYFTELMLATGVGIAAEYYLWWSVMELADNGTKINGIRLLKNSHKQKIEMHVDHVILLVDDDADDREFIEHVLRKVGTGHKIMEAINGEDCLEKLRSLIEIHELPCLIILDLNMPKLDGKQTLSAIRGDRRLKHVPVIIFSTAPNDRDRDFFKDHNAEYIMKPLEYKAFFPIAQRMLNRCNVHSDSSK